MQIELRACRANELRQFLETADVPFGQDVPEERVERFARIAEPDRLLGAFDGEQMIGTAGAYRLMLTVPGGEVPAAGITEVGVLPAHRRRGILTRMMRRQLDDVRAWGEPLAILWASESGIYQRFGYGIATQRAAIDVECDRAQFRDGPPPGGRTRLVGLEEARQILPEVHERVRRVTPGCPKRSGAWWDVFQLADPAERRGGGGPLFRAVWEIDAAAEAYALFRVHQSWETDGIPEGWLEVTEAMATTPVAYREIWRFLFGVDLVARMRAQRLPIDTPLPLMLAEPRRLRLRIADGLWLRVVDVAEALRARSYADRGTLVFRLTDPFCPWNEGCWRLEAGGSGAHAGTTSAPPDLRLRAEDLGAVYLGGVSFHQLARAGRLEEMAPDAVARADALFRTPAAPWAPDAF